MTETAIRPPEFVTIGRTTGKYFVPGKLERLLDLSRTLADMGATEMRAWYDDREDFHCLDGIFNGFRFAIRYYIVFRLSCNGHSTTAEPHNDSFIPWRLPQWANTTNVGNQIYGQPEDINPERVGCSPVKWDQE